MKHERKNSWGWHEINGEYFKTVDNSYSFDSKRERDYFASQSRKTFPKVRVYEIKSGKRGEKKTKYYATTSQIREK